MAEHETALTADPQGDVVIYDRSNNSTLIFSGTWAMKKLEVTDAR